MNSENSNNKVLIRGTILYAIGNLGSKIISFLIVPLYTYYISTGDMGDYDIIISTVALFTPLITLRVSDAAYRWMLHKSVHIKNCISATYRVLLFSTVVITVIILGFNLLFPIRYCGYFIGLLIFGRWLESLQTLLRGLKKQGLFAISGIIYTLIYVLLNLFKVVFLHQGVEAMLQSSLVSQSITILIIMVAEPELRTGIICTKENRQLTQELLKYSAPLVPSALSWWIMGASDRYIILYFLGRSATGIYAVANKFPTIVSTFFTIFNLSWNDVVIGKIKEGTETVDYSSKLFKNLYELSFSFILLLIPLTKIVTTMILADSYKVASAYIGFLYLGAVFQGFTAFISAGMLQGTKTNAIAISSSVGAVINLGVNLLLVKYIGIHAASVSTFLGFFVMWLMRMHDIKEISPVNIDKLNFSVYLLLCVAMSTASIWSTSIANLIFTVIFGIYFLIHNRKMIQIIINRVIRRR